MRYEKAQKSDKPTLTDLWHRCFGDSEAQVREFWKKSDRIEVFVAREKTITAMLCALPVTYFDDCGEMYQASYLYAICTDEKFRNRGICSQLISHAEQMLKKQGKVFVFLTPATEKLFDFYAKMGYQTAFYHKKYEVLPEGKAKIQKIDVASYQNIRQMQLYDNFVSYDDEILALQSGLYRIETADSICCAAAEKHGDELLIKEILPDEKQAAAALTAHLGCKSATVRTNMGQTPFAMAKSLSDIPVPENAYLGLAFD